MNKYRNRKVTIDGIVFDSVIEGQTYCELKLLERARKIQNLCRQVKFELQPSYKKNGKTIRPIYYIADFTYFDVEKQQTIVIDTKGFRTEIFKLKKKMFEYKYPSLEIKEIRREDLR